MMDGNALKTQSALRAGAGHDNATPTVAPAAPRCGVNYDRFVTHQPRETRKDKRANAMGQTERQSRKWWISI